MLPPLAVALEAFGWRDALAAQLLRIKRATPRISATYALWIAVSALLTLDVAAVAAASVGLAVAGENEDEQRWQLGSAALGANVGSLLFPFSNLTNLLLVASAGLTLTTFITYSILPQAAAAVAVGVLLAIRARRAIGEQLFAAPEETEVGPSAHRTRGAAIAAGVAFVGAIAAIIAGAIGADMAIPFAVCSGMLVGAAIASGRAQVPSVVRSIPVAGVAVVVAAALAGPLIADLAAYLPKPGADAGGLLLALVVGAALSGAVNNLPAAALGTVWLVGSPAPAIIAFLIGTNIAVVATPHGSVATMLAYGVGRRQGIVVEVPTYLRSAWRYGLVGSVAALAALLLTVLLV